MVIVRLSSGFGNQLFQYATGRAISARTGSPLKLDLVEYDQPGRRNREVHARSYELHRLKIRESLLEPGEQAKVHVWLRRRYRLIGRFVRLLSPAHVPKILIDRQDGYDPRVQKAPPHVYLSGYWQAERYFAEIADILRQELVFKASPDSANAELIGRIIACDSVCVHVRRGHKEYNSVTNGLFRLVEPAYYRAAIDMIRERVQRPQFFVFSDDAEWAREHLSRCCNAEFVTLNSKKQDHEDLRLMTHCRHFVIPNSTFSWWARGSARVRTRSSWCRVSGTRELTLGPRFDPRFVGCIISFSGRSVRANVRHRNHLHVEPSGPTRADLGGDAQTADP